MRELNNCAEAEGVHTKHISVWYQFADCIDWLPAVDTLPFRGIKMPLA